MIGGGRGWYYLYVARIIANIFDDGSDGIVKIKDPHKPHELIRHLTSKRVLPKQRRFPLF